MTLKQALWEIVRDENIIITNQNIDWLLDRAEKRANDNTNKNNLKGSILERKEKLDKLGEPENKSNEELFKQALVEGVNRHFDKTIEEAKKIEQIEEMAKTIDDNIHYYSVFGKPPMVSVVEIAKILYNAGYRKQSEGHWIENEDDFWVMCSECGTEFWDDQIGIVNTYGYCPNCGAKMKGGEE